LAKKYNIINSLYLGPLEIWKHLSRGDVIFLECHENYQKKSFRNKCEIVCSAGVELLSIPLKKGKHGGIPITEVEVAYHEPWIAQHDKKIKDAYIKSPYYDFYIHDLREIWNQEFTFLYDLNEAILKWTLHTLQLDIPIIKTEAYHKTLDDTYRDLRPMSQLQKNDNSHSYPTYPQVYEYKIGFKPNLSILDLIMNQGPESIVYLKQLSDK